MGRQQPARTPEPIRSQGNPRRERCDKRIKIAPLACALVFAIQPSLSRAIELIELSLEELLNIEISSVSRYLQSQAEAPSAVTVVTREDIRRYGWRNLAELLSAQRGFHAIYDRSFHYIGVRGFSPPGDFNSRILFLIDGMRVNDSVYDSVMAGGSFPLDLALIERVEIVRGPGASIYGGNALFGVINIVTRSPASLSGGEVALAAGSRGSREGRLVAGGSNDRLAGMVSVSGHRSDGGRYAFPEIAPDYVSPDGADRERWDRFFGRFDLSGWRAMLVHGQLRKHAPDGLYGTLPGATNTWQQDTFTLGHLTRDFAIDDKQNLQIALSAGRYEYYSNLPYAASAYGTSDDVLYNDDVTGTWWGGDVRWLSQALPDQRWVVGLEWLQDKATMIGIDRYAETDGGTVVTPYPGGPDYRGHRLGLYAQNEITLNEGLTTTLGLRWDKAKGHDAQLSPRVALVAKLGEKDTAKLLYGTAFRNPNRSEQAAAPKLLYGADRSLEAERIQTLEAVWDHRFDPSAQLTASLYHYRLEDVLTRGFDDTLPSALVDNGPPVRAYGAEVEYLWRGAEGMSLRASYSAQFLKQAGERPANAPRHLAKVNFTLPLGIENLLLGLEGQALSARRTLLGTTVAGHALANATLSWRHRDWDLAASVYNLFDRHYAHPAPYDPWLPFYTGVERDRYGQDGRTWRLSATLRF